MRSLSFAIIVAVALAGCGGGGSSSTPPPSRNPTSVAVTVTSSTDAPEASTTVSLSTSITTNTLNQPIASGVVSTAVTDSTGLATISPPATGDFCLSAAQGSLTGNGLSYKFVGQCFTQPMPATYTLKFTN